VKSAELVPPSATAVEAGMPIVAMLPRSAVTRCERPNATFPTFQAPSTSGCRAKRWSSLR